MKINSKTQRGFTLLEMMISAVVLLLLGATITTSLGSMDKLTDTGQTQSTLILQGEKALNRIIEDLKSSGVENIGGDAYPYLFDDGNAQGSFAAHWHPPANKEAQPGDPDFGPNREIVFLKPQPDAVDPGRPDIGGDGELIWDAADFSYVVITDPTTGVNWLVRNVDAGGFEIISRNVERIAFENSADTGFVIPLDAIRVRIWYRLRNDQGNVLRHFVETVVKLRNGNGL